MINNVRMDSNSVYLEEKGIKFPDKEFKKATEKAYYYNAKLSGIRELVYATLHIEQEDAVKPLVCLDGLAKSGLAGIQWKKSLRKSVHVIVASKYSDAVKQTCELNGMQYSDWQLDADHVTGQHPIREQGDNEVLISPFSPQAVLHKEACNFVYIHCILSATNYTDSVFSNIRDQGVVCILTSSITSQCVRTPQLIQRQYAAHVKKTEYVKEMALRVLIADLGKSAARYQRGIEVLFCCSVEDHFLVTVRVSKNSQAAVDTVELCGRVLHCLMCEERVRWPQVNTPVENPYGLLSCDCKANTPGKTAVILGPMWLGSIFNVDYLRLLHKKCSELSVSDRMLSLLCSLIVEGVCSSCVVCGGNALTDDEKKSSGNKSASANANTQTDGKKKNSEEKSVSTNMGDKISTTNYEVKLESTNGKKGVQGDTRPESETDKVNVPAVNVADSVPHHSKESSRNKSAEQNSFDKQTIIKEDSSEPASKRQKLDVSISDVKTVPDSRKPCASCHSSSQSNTEKKTCPPMPLFYYDVQQKKYAGYPKLSKLVSVLQEAGYQASRTHFENYGIRTSATIKQMEAVIQKHKLSKS